MAIDVTPGRPADVEGRGEIVFPSIGSHHSIEPPLAEPRKPPNKEQLGEPPKPRKKDPILLPAPWPQHGNRKAAGPRKKARVASPTASMSIAG